MRGRLLIVAGIALGTAATYACGTPTLPGPPLVEHPTSALVEVPYPPPPARVEAVPRRPEDDGAVWIDGEWVWQTRRWAWKRGRWARPPVGARFAPWTTVRDRVGTLYLASGTWRDARGAPVAEPPPLAIGETAPAAVITPEGSEVREGPLAPQNAGVLSADESGDEALDALDAARSGAHDGGAEPSSGATMTPGEAP